MSPDLEVTVVVPGDIVADALSDDWIDDLDHLDHIGNNTAVPQSERVEALVVAAVKRAPRPIEVGDTVSDREGDFATVLLVDGDFLVLRWCPPNQSRRPVVMPAERFARVDPDREEAPRG